MVGKICTGDADALSNLVFIMKKILMILKKILIKYINGGKVCHQFIAGLSIFWGFLL